MSNIIWRESRGCSFKNGISVRVTWVKGISNVMSITRKQFASRAEYLYRQNDKKSTLASTGNFLKWFCAVGRDEIYNKQVISDLKEDIEEATMNIGNWDIVYKQNRYLKPILDHGKKGNIQTKSSTWNLDNRTKLIY